VLLFIAVNIVWLGTTLKNPLKTQPKCSDSEGV